jgi:GntR family transcriptional regulator
MVYYEYNAVRTPGGGRVLIVIDSNSGIPVYRQIIDQIRFQVASGLLGPGDELPSTRTVSQELGVNPMTVSKSYRLLEEAGILTRRPGLPLRVSDRSAAGAEREREAQLEGLLAPVAVAARQLGLGEEAAVEIFRRVLAAGGDG